MVELGGWLEGFRGVRGVKRVGADKAAGTAGTGTRTEMAGIAGKAIADGWYSWRGRTS